MSGTDFSRGLLAGGAAAGAVVAAFGLWNAFVGKTSPSTSTASGASGAGAAGGGGAADAAKSSAVVEISTTSSGHSGAVYETRKAVNEYLLFHFGADMDSYFPYSAVDLKPALSFPVRTAELCKEWLTRAEESGPVGSARAKRRALDVGCSVGRSTFRLAELFDEAVGIDFSQAFVDAANRLKESREHPFTYLVEGELEASAVARIGAGLDTSKVHFQRGDACHLDVAALGRFHVIHGANLLCRLPDPQLFLDTLPSLLVDRGLVLFISPYSWLPSYTEKKHWIGGFADAEGKPVWSREGLIERMSKNFELLAEDDIPFVIREHRRKFQLGCSHLTVWIKKASA